MKILALDVATKTGWACADGSGVFDFSIKRDESAGMRLVRFKAKLSELKEALSPDIVVFERTSGFHKNAIIVQSELHGVLKLFCETENLNYRAYSASEIKKHATGKGNANKQKMIDAAVSKWPEIKVIDDNHADALWIYDLASNDLMCGQRWLETGEI